MSTRKENWPQLLTHYCIRVAGRPFKWGENDCCTLAADWVLECTGEDLMRAWRGSYHSAVGARRLIHKSGGLAEAVSSVLDEPLPPTFAQRGDVVLAEYQLGPTLGVCLGALSLFPGIDGAHHLPSTSNALAWRVG